MNLDDTGSMWGGIPSQSDVRAKKNIFRHGPISFRGEKCWCGALAKVARQSLLGGEIKWECDEHGFAPVKKEEPRLFAVKREGPVAPSLDPIQLHIGAGTTHLDGWVNQDMYPAENIDLAFDLMGTWPLEDNSVKTAYASHVLEHLPNPQHFFRELWRVCRPNASVVIRVPYGAHDAAWWDLTHLRPWLAASFCFLQPGYAGAVKNPQHDAWKHPFGVEIVQLRLNGFIARKLRHWWWRVWLWDWLPFMWNGIEEITAYLYVLKSPEAVAEYLTRYKPATVPVKYSAWEYQVFGRPTPLPGEPLKLIDIADGEPIAATYKT